jgi:hypothetical protein
VARTEKFELEGPAPILDEEDKDKLAFGKRKLVEPCLLKMSPKRLPKWITASPYTQRALSDLVENIGRIAEDYGKPHCLFRKSFCLRTATPGVS